MEVAYLVTLNSLPDPSASLLLKTPCRTCRYRIDQYCFGGGVRKWTCDQGLKVGARGRLAPEVASRTEMT